MSEQNKNLLEAVEKLGKEHKIIGYSEYVGVYELGIVGEGDSASDEIKNKVISHQRFELKKYEQRENFLKFSFVAFQVNHLLGEILTTLEATIEDERKLEATKSIVKNYFRKKLDWILECCSVPQNEMELIDQDK